MENHYIGDIGEVEYIRLQQPEIYSENYYTKKYVEQFAIAELEKAKDKISYYLLKFDYFTPKQLRQVDKMIKAIDQQISNLKGDK